MKLFKSKKLVLVSLIITLLLFTTMFSAAASTKKMLEAYYGVKVQYNGQTLTSTQQPFIVNGSTYVPLRMIMDSFGDKSVVWNAASQSVVISNKTSNMEQVYMQQILSRNKEIADLKAQIAKINDDNAYLKDTINNPDVDIDDLEDDLNDTFKEYDDKDITISLDGDNEKIELTVKIDEDEWDAFDQDDKEKFLDKVCDDIWDVEEAEDADIEGDVKDGSKTLDSFEVKADKSVDLEDIEDILDDLAKTIENRLDNDWDDEGIRLDLSLDGDEDNIDFKVEVDLDADEDLNAWNDLRDSDLEDLLKAIYDEIEDEYDERNTDIDGVVYDTDDKSNAATFKNGTTFDRIVERD